MNGNYLHEASEGRRLARKASEAAKAAKAGRDGDAFVALPFVVLSSPGWLAASHTARSLLMAVAASGPNGALSASKRYLAPLGWTSADTVTRCLRELIACGLLHETRKGRLPNVSSCYAVTWLEIRAELKPLDQWAVKAFARGAYMRPKKAAPEPQRRRTAAATATRQMNAWSRAAGYTPTPLNGIGSGPCNAVQRCGGPSAAPSDGAMRPDVGAPTTPSNGTYLDIAISAAQAAAEDATIKAAS